MNTGNEWLIDRKPKREETKKMHRFLARVTGWVLVTVIKRENTWSGEDDDHQIVSDML